MQPTALSGLLSLNEGLLSSRDFSMEAFASKGNMFIYVPIDEVLELYERLDDDIRDGSDFRDFIDVGLGLAKTTELGEHNSMRLSAHTCYSLQKIVRIYDVKIPEWLASARKEESADPARKFDYIFDWSTVSESTIPANMATWLEGRLDHFASPVCSVVDYRKSLLAESQTSPSESMPGNLVTKKLNTVIPSCLPDRVLSLDPLLLNPVTSPSECTDLTLSDDEIEVFSPAIKAEAAEPVVVETAVVETMTAEPVVVEMAVVETMTAEPVVVETAVVETMTAEPVVVEMAVVESGYKEDVRDTDSMFVAVKYLGLDNSARRHGLDFTLSISELTAMLTNPVCYYTGVSLVHFRHDKKKVDSGEIILPYNYLTIDRLDRNEGYVSGNLVTCSNAIQKLKSSMGHREFEAVLSYQKIINHTGVTTKQLDAIVSLNKMNVHL